MRLKKRPQVRRAAVAAEMAIALPLLLTLVLGVIDATRLCMVAQLLTNAARAGCRVAVLASKGQSDVDAIVQANLNSCGITTYTSVMSPSNFQSTSQGDPITLTINVNFRDVSWLPAPFLFGSTTITASAVMSSEH